MRLKEEVSGVMLPQPIEVNISALDIDQIVEDIQKRLKVKCRSSPYALAGKHNPAQFVGQGKHGHGRRPVLLQKCSKCFCRSCKCNWSPETSISDSCAALRQLLSEQTLIQEAVRRVLSKPDLKQDHELEDDDNENETKLETSRNATINTSYESEEDIDI